MMKCFYIFKDKDKSKSRAAKSAPELSERSKADDSQRNRAAKSTGSMSSTRSIPEMYKEKEQDLKVFSLRELQEATNNFNRLLKIGEGGFGSVYKGSIKPANGKGQPTIVAIKKLNTQGLQGHKQWVAEVQFLGVLDHPNLVKLLGYCSVDGERGIQRLLVYEYMPNKSLEDHLFNRAKPTIPWITRLNIILGAAQGMAYLHEGLEVQVIYRDFKSSNVLLDKDFNPKLSDFGLAREERKLLEWVRQFPADSKKFSMIIDPRLQNQYSLDAARRIAKLADSCLNKNAKDRPSMSRVVEILKLAIEESEGTSFDPRSAPSLRTNLATAPNKPFGSVEAASTSRPIPHMAQA
ncbi:putative serine/threonine-protein kinase PBL19 [Sesamum alatum]|uniref:non-specific serine/threonine protein kinase n=1 Tax=Sesamum alatum TaxID=300844 RepID=A0AAE1Y3G3_9LAMI|nr:putative serine/threonine-protein kinase PBL19 [Sesamum alatum]